MKKEFKPFPLYEFSGTEREIGRQYGEELRQECKDMINYWYGTLNVMYNKPLDKMVAACAGFEKPIKDYCPFLYEELVGISEGTGLSMNEVLFINCGFEIDGAGTSYLGGCTDFAAAGSLTKDGKTIVGQNFDWYTDSPTIVLRVKPDNGPEYLGVTWPGHLVQVGINGYGIGMFINLLLSPKGVYGVPYAVTCNQILYQRNVPDAIHAISRAQRATSFNYTIAGKDGEMVCVETTPDRIGIIEPVNDILTHSNHYQCHYLQGNELATAAFADTHLRAYRMRQLIEAQRGELTPEGMKLILQDHRGWPDSICRHLDMIGPSDERFETIFSCISVPEDGKLWSTPNPCQNPYTLYTL